MKDFVFFLFTLLFASFIWFRDPSWMTYSDETLPILVSLPLMVILGRPWRITRSNRYFASSFLMLSTVFFCIGTVSDLTVAFALSWCFLVWSWAKCNLSSSSLKIARRLSVLALLAFPWITLDLQPLGWWFRLTGAGATAQMFDFLGYHVVQVGTNVLIDGMGISVQEACSGLNALQSMLISGSVAAFCIFTSDLRYFANLPSLFFIAWLSNTLRIMVLAAIGVFFSPVWVQGEAHIWVGWLVLMIMFYFCYQFFCWQQAQEDASQRSLIPACRAFFEPEGDSSQFTNLNMDYRFNIRFIVYYIASVAFCAWSSKEIIPAWVYGPFDKLGWVIFFIWCLPVIYCGWCGSIFKGRVSHRSVSILLFGIFLCTFGLLGGLNALSYLGLALTIASPLFFKDLPSFLWVISSSTWMPFFGYLLQMTSPCVVFIAKSVFVVISLGIYFCFGSTSYSSHINKELR